MSYSHSSFPSAAGTATSALALMLPRQPHHRLAFAGPALPPHIPLHANAKSKGPKCGGQNIAAPLFDSEPPARNDCYESFRHRQSKPSRCRLNNMFMSYSSLSPDDADIPSFSDDADGDNDGTEPGVLDEESAVVDTGYATEAVEALDDAALAGGEGEGDDDEKGRIYEDSDDIFAGEEDAISDYTDDEVDGDDDDSYFDDEEDEDEDGLEFDESALEELDFSTTRRKPFSTNWPKTWACSTMMSSSSRSTMTSSSRPDGVVQLVPAKLVTTMKMTTSWV